MTGKRTKGRGYIRGASAHTVTLSYACWWTSDGRSQTTHGSTHRRPPGSFRGAPDGDKGRGGERANGKAARAHTQKTHGSHGTHNRQERTGSEGSGKKDMIYLRERREKNTAETRKSV